jgi:hypothetical protein
MTKGERQREPSSLCVSVVKEAGGFETRPYE